LEEGVGRVYTRCTTVQENVLMFVT
jgi:hypothetical protein